MTRPTHRLTLRRGLAVGLVVGLLAGQGVLPALAQSASPGGSAPPSPSASPGPAIVWDTGTVRLTATALRISAGGLAFTGQVPSVDLHSDDSSATYRTLEAIWQEQGREQRLNLYLAADAGSWWVTEVRTYDGSPSGEWVTFPAPAFRLPLGATWSGDLRLVGPGATLTIDDLTLRAFSPDTIPDSLRACHPAQDISVLTDAGITAMTPANAKALLLSLGLCHSFRHDLDLGNGQGYSEFWCDAPPGVIRDVLIGDDGSVIVFVEDAVPQVRVMRDQPPGGWGC